MTHRRVERATVIEVSGNSWARYRGASFQGRIEVVGPDDLEVAQSHAELRTVRGVLSWFGWTPRRRYVSITLSGPCTVYESFDGEVIAELGIPKLEVCYSN